MSPKAGVPRGWRLIEVRGDRLDQSAGEEMYAEMEKTAKEDNSPIALDLKNVHFVDSSGLGAILRSFKFATQHKRMFALISLGTQPRRLLKTLRLDAVLSVYKDGDELPNFLNKDGDSGDLPQQRDAALGALEHLIDNFVLSIENVFGRLPDGCLGRIREAVPQNWVMERDQAKKISTEVLGYFAHTERQKQLQAMTKGITHCLNNMLVPILGEAQLLGSTIKKREHLKSVAAIEGAARRIAQLVRRLQGIAGEQLIGQKPGPTDLNALARDLIEVARVAWAADGDSDVVHEIELFEREVPMAMVSAPVLRDALLGLLHNAREAMPAGGKITVRTAFRHGMAAIIIQDEGPGMKWEEIRTLSEPFQTTKELPHTGLGLSLANMTVERYGGSLKIASQPGDGTSVEILLPCAKASGKVSVDGRKTRGRIASRKGRILIVEDEAPVRTFLGRALTRMGHRPVLASDAESALRAFGVEAFDLILTDWGLPEMDGLEMARVMKNKRPETPIILFTGWEASRLQNERSEGWIDAVLKKPLELSDLESAVEQHIPQRRR